MWPARPRHDMMHNIETAPYVHVPFYNFTNRSNTIFENEVLHCEVGFVHMGCRGTSGGNRRLHSFRISAIERDLSQKWIVSFCVPAIAIAMAIARCHSKIKKGYLGMLCCPFGFVSLQLLPIHMRASNCQSPHCMNCFLFSSSPRSNHSRGATSEAILH